MILPIKNISNFFSSLNQKNKGGSGKTIYSIGRAHSIRINPISSEDIYKIYKDYPITFSIINDIVDAVRNTPIWISKDGEELKGDSVYKFKSIIKNPNRKYSGYLPSDIAFQLITYGRAIILKKEYITKDVELYLIDNRNISEIKYKYGNYSDRSIDYVKYFTYSDGIKKEYISYSCYEIKLYESNIDINDRCSDFSCPIVSSRSELQTYANLIDALDANYSDGGARKIISFKNQDGSYSYSETILPEEEKKLHEKFKEDYGRNLSDRKYILSQKEVSVSDLSLPTQQLDTGVTKPIIEASICNSFKYPPQLLGIKNGAYKSLTEAEEAFYIRCVSPIANLIFENICKIANISIDGKIELDYSEYEFFFVMKSKKATSIQTMMQGLSTAVSADILDKKECKTIIKSML